MAYVGNQPARGQWRKLSDISSTFDGVITTFTTSVPPGTSQYFVTAGSASQLLISLGGVIQEPDVDYTVSTNSVTFTTPPTSGLSFFGVLCGDALNAGVPSDGSVTTSKLAGGLSVGLTGGSVSTPSLFFTGDDNTGVFSAGADQLNIATNGVERVEFGTSEVVFNDGGANYDFRIEGDTNANLFFVDASAEAVGIGTTSPGAKLNIAGSDETIRLNHDDAYINFKNTADNAQQGFIQIRSSNTSRFWVTASQDLQFATANTERVRIDASGRLLVGTSSTSATNTVVIQGHSGGSTGQGIVYLAKGAATPADGDQIGAIWFSDNTHTASAGLNSQRDGGTWSGTSKPSRLVFSTTADGASSPTERMRITSSGSVQSTNWTFSPSAINSRAVYFATDPDWGGAGGGGLVAINTSNGVVLGVSATSWASYSDIRMKTDLVPIENGLTKVSTLRAVTGRYNTDDANTSRSFLIAQDVEKVLPEAVESGNPDALGLRYTEVIPLLVAALKESKERIEQLETEMAAVKAQLS